MIHISDTASAAPAGSALTGRKDRRFLHPPDQLIINLPCPGEQDMMGPASGVRLHRRIYARGPGTVSKPKGHNNINLRPLLRFPHRQEGNKSKMMSVGKAICVFCTFTFTSSTADKTFCSKASYSGSASGFLSKKYNTSWSIPCAFQIFLTFMDDSLSHNTIRQYQRSILPGPPCCTEAVWSLCWSYSLSAVRKIPGQPPAPDTAPHGS